MKLMRASMRGLLLALMLCLGVGTAYSQEGRGLIVMDPANTPPIANYALPRLFQYDPFSGALRSAAPDNLALAVDFTPSAERELTLRIREDLTWADGQPVTAWDTLALLSRFDGTLEGIAIGDDYTLRLRFSDGACSNAASVNAVIGPAAPGFVAAARRFHAEQPGFHRPDQWIEAIIRAGVDGWDRAVNLVGAFTYYQMPQAPGDRGFTSLRGEQALWRVSSDAALSPEERFLRGETNLLVNPAFERRADLRSQPDVQVYEAPGWRAYFLVFNLADSSTPRSAFTARGQLLDQGFNAFFADLRVRQAVQLGIDVPSIIEAVYQGGATPIAGTLSPASWGYNPTLQPSVYDPGAAARLLDSAGWVDTNGDGIRNCYGCLHAEPGSSLNIGLRTPTSEGGIDRVTEMLRIQLRRIGIGVGGAGDPASQNFDLFLASNFEDYTMLRSHDPDQTDLLTRAADVIGGLGNVGSYYNPALETLLEQARTVPGCALDARAALYHQVQALLAEDIPVIGLFAVHDMVLARGIDGFAPQPGDPFWNLPNWRVTR